MKKQLPSWVTNCSQWMTQAIKACDLAKVLAAILSLFEFHIGAVPVIHTTTTEGVDYNKH